MGKGGGATTIAGTASPTPRTRPMTDTQLEILHNAYLLHLEGKGQVVEDWAWPFAHQLHVKGWLDMRTEHDGATSWWWTKEAETALDLSALTDVEGREN
jgi:hypothetical protein